MLHPSFFLGRQTANDISIDQIGILIQDACNEQAWRAPMTSSSTLSPGIHRSIEGSRSAPCLGLAIMAAGLLWAGLGSTVALLLA